MIDPTQCVLTDGKFISIQRNGTDSSFSYRVIYGGRDLTITVCEKCWSIIEKEIVDKRHIVQGLIINGKIPEIENGTLHWEPTGTEGKNPIFLKQLLEKVEFPRTEKEKKDNLFQYLYNRNFPHEWISKEKLDSEMYLPSTLYFKSTIEFNAFFNKLVRDGLLENLVKDGKTMNLYYVKTYEGEEYLRTEFREKQLSKTCFIAMSFDPTMKPTREAIKNAIVECGYVPDVIDELDISTAGTINDMMLKRIANCKFAIADYTMHRNGVYFEAGYALGKGKEVFYSCHRRDFKDLHFDIKAMQVIGYDDLTELERGLIQKIKRLIR